MKRITVILITLSSLSLGIVAGLGLWFAGSWSGSMRVQAQLFYQTQEFKDAVRDGKPFVVGGYKFNPRKRNIAVEYRADLDTEAPMHAAKAQRNFVRSVGK